MKILIVGLVKSELLVRLRKEGEKRGHGVHGCYTSELVIEADNKSFSPNLRGKSMDEYDVVVMWSLGKRRWEWYAASYYLNKKNKTIIVNNKVIDPNYKLYLTPAMNYLKQMDEKLPFPRSAIILSSKSIDSVIEGFDFPVIIKSSAGRQGKGVFLVNSKDELVRKVEELEDVVPSFIIREFIPNDGDVRIFTVGYKAIGAMKRTPTKKGEFRSNISVGGKGEKFDLGKYPQVKDVAEKISDLTKTEIAGVDIMINKETGDPYILEVNPGPQFMGLEKYTGVNVAEVIMKYFEKLNQKR
jgi:RimK family alpha-L-glutamate ligase